MQLCGDPLTDADTLLGALAASDADLFNQDGSVVLHDDGALKPVTADVLRETSCEAAGQPWHALGD